MYQAVSECFKTFCAIRYSRCLLSCDSASLHLGASARSAFQIDRQAWTAHKAQSEMERLGAGLRLSAMRLIVHRFDKKAWPRPRASSLRTTTMEWHLIPSFRNAPWAPCTCARPCRERSSLGQRTWRAVRPPPTALTDAHRSARSAGRAPRPGYADAPQARGRGRRIAQHRY